MTKFRQTSVHDPASSPTATVKLAPQVTQQQQGAKIDSDETTVNDIGADGS